METQRSVFSSYIFSILHCKPLLRDYSNFKKKSVIYVVFSKFCQFLLQCRPRNIIIDTFLGLQVNLNPYQGLKIPLNGSNSWKTSNFCKFQKKFCVVDSMAEQKFLPWITYIEVWKNRFWRNFRCNFFFWVNMAPARCVTKSWFCFICGLLHSVLEPD